MSMKDLKFPDHFLWGASSSAHQHDGGTINDWARWEAKGGNRVEENAVSGRTADHWNRYTDDFVFLSQMNLNCYRFAISWARVEPTQGNYDETALAHYDDVFADLKKRGITPMITLHHFTNPLWVADMGGWKSRQTVKAFERFAMMIVERYGAQVSFWLTINEPTIESSLAYMYGIWPPGEKNPLSTLRVLNNLLRAHNDLYSSIHTLYSQKGWPKPSVSFAHHMFDMVPATNSPINRFITRLYLLFTNDYCHIRTKKRLDFIGLNYYFHKELRFKLGGSGGIFDEAGSGGKTSDLGWEIYPKGLSNLCLRLKKYDLPIYITENGLADQNDTQRANFIVSHLAELHRAIEQGADVRGYIHWSLLDGFEWEHGFRGSYGLVKVNFDTLERTLRPSAKVYGLVAKTNILSTNIQEDYS
jgi:beta-glucosidase